MKRPKKPGQGGKLIDIGKVELTAGGGMAADARHRNRAQTRQAAVEEFVGRHADNLPYPVGILVAECARAGVRKGQGAGHPSRPISEQAAINIARVAAPKLYAQYLTAARASGRHRSPRAWARHQAAAAIRDQLVKARVKNPPSIATIMKWKM